MNISSSTFSSVLPANTAYLPAQPTAKASPMAVDSDSANTAYTAPSALPSTYVTISNAATKAAQMAAAAAQEMALNAVKPVWKNQSQDEVSLRMAHNLKETTLARRFQNMGSTLLHRFKTGSGSFSQSVQLLKADGTQESSGLFKRLESNVALSIKTASGATVNLTLKNQESGLSVDIESDGSLSDKEREAIAGLANGFQDALDGLGSVPPSINLAGLTQFDPKVLTAVDLQANVTDPASPISIRFSANQQGRTVNIQNTDGKLQLAVDTSNPLIQGSKAQRAASVNHYLEQADAAAQRGGGPVYATEHGSSYTQLVGLFKSAFAQMHSDYGPQDSKPVYAGGPDARTQAALTGLADFSVDIKGNTYAPNPLHQHEVDAFSWKVSQTSNVNENKSAHTQAISQQQQAHLVASYHWVYGAKMNQGFLDTTKPSQGYFYDQVDDSAQSNLNMTSQDGELTSATLAQSASQSFQETKFSMAKVVNDITLSSAEKRSENLLGILSQVTHDGKSKAPGKDEEAHNTVTRLHNLIQLQTTSQGLIDSSSIWRNKLTE